MRHSSVFLAPELALQADDRDLSHNTLLLLLNQQFTFTLFFLDKQTSVAARSGMKHVQDFVSA